MSILRGSGRPKEYQLADGSKVCGVTTIIGRFKEAGALIGWAYNQGKAGVPLYEKRDQAQEVGTLAHEWIQADIHHDPLPSIHDDMLERVQSAVSAYKEWVDGARLEIIATEIPLVSELYRYGGTIDAIARDGKGRMCLLDWKTSNAVYSDYAIQLSAYRQLWNETADETMLIADGGYHLCRFSKTDGDFEHRFWPDLSEAWELFKLLIPAYELDRKLRARIK